MIKRRPLVLAITILLSLLIGMFQVISNMGKISDEMVALSDQKLLCFRLVDELRQSSDDLTRMARTYSVTSDPTYKAYFEQILKIRNGSSPRPLNYNDIFWDLINPANNKLSQVKYGESISLIRLMKRAGFTHLEIKKVQEAEKISNELANQEKKALAAVEGVFLNKSGKFTKVGVPDQKLGQYLLHNIDYHRIKAKIMLPLRHVSRMLDARFQNQIKLHQIEQSKLQVWGSIGLVGILFLMVFSLYFYKSTSTNGFSSQVKGQSAPIRKITIALLVLVSMLIVSFVTWLAITDAEKLELNKISRHLQTTLNTTNEMISIWAESEFYRVNKISISPKLIKMTKALLEHSKLSKDLPKSKMHKDLNKHLMDQMMDTDLHGFCIIDPEGFSIASSRERSIGTTNLIYLKRHDLFDRVLKGETVLVPPILSHISLNDETVSQPTMFYLVPIKNEAKVIVSVLAFSLDPSQMLSRFTQMGSFDETGETYAFDANGLLISNIRFEEQLRAIGLLKKGEHSALKVYVKNPGANLTKGHEVPANLDELPLTLMAASATSGYSGNNLEGYSDYRGVVVLGTWLWNSKLGIGMATEVDKDKAMQMFESMRFTIILVIAVTVFILILLAILFISFEHKSKRVLKQAHDSLELTVEERTSDLKDTILELESIQEELKISKVSAENTNASLRVEQTLIQVMFDSIPDLIFIKNEQGIYQNCNNAFSKFVGVEREKIIGFSDYDIFIKEVADIFVEKDRKIIKSLQPSSNEEWVNYPDGHKVLLDTLKVPFLDVNEKLLGLLGISRDITDRNLAEQKVLKSKQIAEEATRAKSDFLANMSHEIRTPMNAIIGLSNLALEGKLDEKQRNYIEKVSRSGDSLLGIINDILDFSKIEAGKMTIENIDFDMQDVLENFRNFVGFQAEQKDIEFVFDIPNDVPFQLVGDPLRLGQVLTNLGNNAVKFTEEGEVVVIIRVKKITQDSVMLHFMLQDSGIGMTKEQVSKLFRSFTQADSSTSRKYGGTGLGLSISKTITEMMGGDIWVESELEKGSTFHFTANFGRSLPESKQTTDLHREILDGLNVLVVDDNATACSVLVDRIGEFANEVKSASSGRVAIDLIESGTSAFDLIIMDQMMPEMDGIETSKKIKEELESTLPIILLSKFGCKVNNEDIRGISFDTLLSKPVLSKSLIKSILVALGHEFKHVDDGRESKKTEAVKRLRGAKVLLVEDNEINQELALDLLKSRGILAELASNGQEALELLSKETFDGVLMDCMMPIMDGYETTQKIRSQHGFEDLPIIAMTANAMLEDRDRAIQCGMNDYITKPINVTHLFITLDKWITPSDVAIKDEVYKDDNSKTLRKIPKLPGIDTKIGLESTDGDIELYIEVLFMVHDRFKSFDEEFRLSLNEVGTEASVRTAHTLKGLAATIGAKQLQNVAYELQKACADSLSSEDITLLLEDVNKELSIVLKGLDLLESIT